MLTPQAARYRERQVGDDSRDGLAHPLAWLTKASMLAPAAGSPVSWPPAGACVNGTARVLPSRGSPARCSARLSVCRAARRCS